MQTEASLRFHCAGLQRELKSNKRHTFYTKGQNTGNSVATDPRGIKANHWNGTTVLLLFEMQNIL